MTLQFRATLAPRGFDAELVIGAGERVAVIGPNGSGKSTLLNILAGTVRPDSGRCSLGDTLLFDLGPGRRHWSLPHARGISLLAQDPLLFPHFSVLGNVAFGPRAAGLSRRESFRRAHHWLREVGLDEFANRKPAQLSGGQAQRVAIARALAAEPRLLLLDEPMAALDVAVAPQVRRLLRRVLVDRAAIVVTHDLLDALVLSDRIVVMERGTVADSGPTDQVLRHPRTRFTARIAGLNLIRGVASDGGLRDPSGLLVEGVGKDGEVLADGEAAAAVFPPTGVSVFTEWPKGSPRNNLQVTIAEMEPVGDLIRVRGDDRRGHVITADVTAHSVAILDLYPGREVIFSVKATAVTIYGL